MSLIIRHLTKHYGAQKAVDDISFSVGKGEVVGFLGPNGAGKSTTLKIAMSYLPPSSGQVLVEGFDVTADPMSVKRVTGYLPEHNPLYLDLFVHEYLLFVGKLYGLRGKTLKKRTAEMIDICGLTREQNKKIENLSKGYRQRVGLAQALLHDPAVLILDEPTSGLDPNQLFEIRKLIRDISINKTVIFSTHIMQEVQALCERVVVINRGKVVANDRLENLLAAKGHVAVEVEFSQPVDPAEFGGLAGIAEISPRGERRFRVVSRPGADVREEIFRFAAAKNISLMGLKQEENTLENIFRELTTG